MSESAPAKLDGSNNMEKLAHLCRLTYQQQCIWFINAYWEDFAKEKAEQFWLYAHKCNDLDIENHEAGCALDELNAHRFLEHFDLTMTVREMRTKLRNTGAVEQNFRFKNVPISHMLIGLHDINFADLVNAAQGSNKKELEKAEALLNEVSAAFDEAKARAEEAKAALAEAKSAEAAAKARAEEAKAAAEEAKAKEASAHAAAEEAKVAEASAHAAAEESKVKEAAAVAAQKELEAALAELKAQEDAYNQKTEDLKRKSEEGGIVSRNRAKNELAQHLGEDPLPLRRAKINQEAAVRKAERATNEAATAREASEKAAAEASTAREASEQAAAEASAAREVSEQAAAAAGQAAAAAEQARAASEQAAAAAEEALDAAAAKVEEAEAYLEEIKSQPGSAEGAIWWMERELYEQKKYLPESKGGIRK